MSDTFVLKVIALPLFLAVTLGVGTGSSRADDTEIYRAVYNPGEAGRPKVLVVIDDSGSMRTIVTSQRPPYDPDNTTYDPVHDSSRVYWSTTGEPPGEDSDQWFESSQNRCAASATPLASVGQFGSRAGRWAGSSITQECSWECTGVQTGIVCFGGEWVQTCVDIENPGQWIALSSSQQSPPHVDCQADVINANPGNGPGQADGYPKTNVVDAEVYSATVPGESNVDWGSIAYTFYSALYMDWYHDDSLVTDRTRMAIAQEVVATIIDANPAIDFGLMEFNGNRFSPGPDKDGGRIVQRIIADMTSTDRTNLIDLVNGIEAAGSTPLCEATYEAYRYLSGSSPVYGLLKSTSGDNWLGTRFEFRDDVADRDTAATNAAGDYIAPSTDCAFTYIILMTDGSPTSDTGANGAIETLTGETCIDYADGGGGMTKNCLPEIAGHMATTDLDGNADNGNQYGITYTIGFLTDQDLLQDTAEAGMGQYYTADDAAELAAAFQGAILNILSTNSTFTSPAVAVDTFSRTESRDDIFYAMFKPGDRVNWPGNIKKLKLSFASGAGVIVDADGAPGISTTTGFISENARTFWSAAIDGGDVLAGGVGGLLASRDPSSRTVYANTGTGGTLETFNSANTVPAAYGLATLTELFAAFGVADQAALDKLLSWSVGFDEYDEDDDSSTADNRPWIMGDVLHSQPLVLNYGALGSFTDDNPDLRLVAGTNAGFVHMFGNVDGAEDWAFFPKELAPILNERRKNQLSSDNIYGVDLSQSSFLLDLNNDGTLDASAGDKVYIYAGLRRGGRQLYALDVSNPDSPAFLWQVSNATAGFAELGQTWSKPVPTHIPGYKTLAGVPKPVVIFGAGYDTGKDSTAVGTTDSMGRGIFIVDAVTGDLVWSITPATDSATNLQEAGLLHSVPAEVSPMDSNSDGLTDRIYFADTGGNIWRVDLPGNTLPTSSQDTWSLVKLGDFNLGTASTDRRFFSAPDIVRIRQDGVAVDSILIASGDRANPTAIDVDNRLYMIRDVQVGIYSSAPPSLPCSDPAEDFRCVLPLTDSSLFNITDDVINTGTSTEQDAARDQLSAANGWVFDLVAAGEKGLSKSRTINGLVYQSTYSPDNLLADINVCLPPQGQGRLHVLNLYDGRRSVVNLGSILPDSITVHVDEVGVIRIILPPGAPGDGSGDCDIDGDGDCDIADCDTDGDEDCDGDDDPPPPPCEGGICQLDAPFPRPYGTHWYQEQY